MKHLNLSEWALNHRQMVAFLIVMLVAGGALSYLKLGRAEDPDFTAAARLARKKRLGPFAKTPLTNELRQKQLATLARGGFSFDIARRVMSTDADTLEALIR